MEIQGWKHLRTWFERLVLFSYHFPHALARVGPSFVLQSTSTSDKKRPFFPSIYKGVNIYDVNLESRLQWQNRLLSFVHQRLLSPELPPFGPTLTVISSYSSFFFNFIWHLLQHLEHQHHHDR